MGALTGQPRGLYVLFFAEMWERFSYYGMRALLTYYMIKGFLGYGDTKAYSVYGAYGALVYAMPVIGGYFADKLLGYRLSVMLGGSLMAAGHLLMTVEHEYAFFLALGLIIVGNGFFKPNISAIVGRLYTADDPRRDGGFTIFYMGVNLGAFLAPLVCGYVGETYGYHYGFGLATLGMLAGLLVFGVFREGLEGIGEPPNRDALKKYGWLLVVAVLAVVPGIAILVKFKAIAKWVLFAIAIVTFGSLIIRSISMTKRDRERLFVVFAMITFSLTFWAFFEQAGSSINLFTDRNVDRVVGDKAVAAEQVGKRVPELELTQEHRGAVFEHVVLTKDNADKSFSGFSITPELVGAELEDVIVGVKVKTPALAEPVVVKGSDEGSVLGELSLGAMPFKSATIEPPSLMPTLAAQKVVSSDADMKLGKDTFYVLMPTLKVTADHVGIKVVRAKVGESLVGKKLDRIEIVLEDAGTVLHDVTITADNAKFTSGGFEVPGSVFQAVNPAFIVLLGGVFANLWMSLARRGKEPSVPIKFGLGLIQLGLGFGVLWLGAKSAGADGMVGMSWLVLAYLLHTTGELCISPVGLSMVTKLAPGELVATVMGAWYLSISGANMLASYLAALTGVSAEDGGSRGPLPSAVETLNSYTPVFGFIGVAACIVGLVAMMFTPVVKKWMHTGE
jgi:dipeptide/tripeptide permease